MSLKFHVNRFVRAYVKVVLEEYFHCATDGKVVSSRLIITTCPTPYQNALIIMSIIKSPCMLSKGLLPSHVDQVRCYKPVLVVIRREPLSAECFIHLADKAFHVFLGDALIVGLVAVLLTTHSVACRQR